MKHNLKIWSKIERYRNITSKLPNQYQLQIYHRPASSEDFDTNYIEGEEVVDENFIDDNKNEEFYGITTEMLGMEVATPAPMTTTMETTTIPISEFIFNHDDVY